MDAELRSFLEEGFGQVRNELAGLKESVGQIRDELTELEEGLGQTRNAVAELKDRVAVLETRVEGKVTELRTLIESVQHDVRVVAEGHSVLFDAISRQSELFVTQLNDVRGMIRVWNDLMHNRIYRIEQQIRA